MAKRKHWMDEIADSIRERLPDVIEAVSEGVKGEVPFGYQPPKPDDEIRSFLNMPQEARMVMFQQMGPEAYQQWSTSMMSKLNHRFGPAAQALMPMLQGAPVEALASGVSLPDDGSVGIPAAEADLTDLLGFNPFE